MNRATKRLATEALKYDALADLAREVLGPKHRRAVNQARKLERRDRLELLASIRVELHRESGGTCAICGLGLPFAVMHAHHIIYGPERQAEERVETMSPLHERCHDWAHGKDSKRDQRDALASLLGWCLLTGRVTAAESLTRRINKIDEARASGRRES